MNVYKVGFTGTQVGMTVKQAGIIDKFLTELLNKYLLITHDSPFEFHHGDCIGSDEEAAAIAFEIGYKICCHPPINPTKRAFFHNNDVMYDLKGYIDRNHDIVDSCDILIATPKEKEEQLRSGTWATIRYARKTGKPVEIIYP